MATFRSAAPAVNGTERKGTDGHVQECCAGRPGALSAAWCLDVLILVLQDEVLEGGLDSGHNSIGLLPEVFLQDEVLEGGLDSGHNSIGLLPEVFLQDEVLEGGLDSGHNSIGLLPEGFLQDEVLEGGLDSGHNSIGLLPEGFLQDEVLEGGLDSGHDFVSLLAEGDKVHLERAGNGLLPSVSRRHRSRDARSIPVAVGCGCSGLSHAQCLVIGLHLMEGDSVHRQFILLGIY
ncbi:uncharacterized protein LOC126988678 [Eriocheir sinensis]|uniref:uncharacterized protein LOC126988678 n=1 Tax=Eriocheir sinensis TaxID=95602 RepID=UPI0021CA2E02|nr:uncharacterized protein LOC126988678 [Eriocheir sinensis]